MIPSSDGRQGRPFRDDRKVIEGIIYRYRCGIECWRRCLRSPTSKARSIGRCRWIPR
ncbi:hypothetical protein [Lacisediminihabitans changchengi]|uniref:hypothetical protein n=1 Tax=Lacisediminihabitans changchengi TaxID=2787634 RepID=UPI00355774D1